MVLAADTFARLLAVPVLAYMVCMWFGLPSLQTQILVIFFALPTASASYILTKVLGGDSQLMAAVISFQNLMCCRDFAISDLVDFLKYKVWANHILFSKMNRLILT